MRILTVFFLTTGLFGQRILYNQDLDKKGQEAADTAKKLASTPVTSKSLQNLKALETQEVDLAIKAGYLTMRSQIQAFETWKDVTDVVCISLRQLYAGQRLAALTVGLDAPGPGAEDPCSSAALKREKAVYDGQLQALRKQLSAKPVDPTRLKASTDALKRTAAAGGDASTKAAVSAAVDRIGDAKDLVDFASEIGLEPGATADKTAKALDKVQQGIEEIGALVESAQNIWSSYQEVKVDPRSLAPSKEKLAAAVLALDADRIKELTMIRASDEMYLADLRVRMEDCQSLMERLGLWSVKTPVESRIRQEGDQKTRVNLIFILHLAAAGAAVNETPYTVGLLRETLAERRYAVRRDAIYNGAYETALQAAGQRLSAYYGAGVKPSQIAQLLYYLSGIVSLPSIAF